jgi:mRNA-degrading endonuclease RelE of RelBE toxin-antitoxin system
MYDLFVKPEADRIFAKLSKKNPKQLVIISKKITEIRTNPNHNYKFLRKPLQN